MTKLPRVKGQELIAALRKAGFDVIHIKGIHHFLRHPDRRCIIIPVHRGEVTGPGLLFKIMHDCEMTRDELEKLL